MNIDIEPIIEDSESVAPEGTVPEPASSGFSPVLDEQPFPAEPEVSPETYRPIISLKHVDIYQKDILILSDVNLTVEKGELVYLVGKTGCGKSSLLKLLYGEVPPHSGEAVVAGFDMTGSPCSPCPQAPGSCRPA